MAKSQRNATPNQLRWWIVFWSILAVLLVVLTPWIRSLLQTEADTTKQTTVSVATAPDYVLEVVPDTSVAAELSLTASQALGPKTSVADATELTINIESLRDYIVDLVNQSGTSLGGLSSTPDMMANLADAQLNVSKYWLPFDQQAAATALWTTSDILDDTDSLLALTSGTTPAPTSSPLSRGWRFSGTVYALEQFDSLPVDRKLSICKRVEAGTYKDEQGQPAAPLLQGQCARFLAARRNGKPSAVGQATQKTRAAVKQVAKQLSVPVKQPAPVPAPRVTAGTKPVGVVSPQPAAGSVKKASNWVYGYKIDPTVVPDLTRVNVFTMPRTDEFTEPRRTLVGNGLVAERSKKIALSNQKLITALNQQQSVAAYTMCFNGLKPFYKQDANQVQPWDETNNPTEPPTLQFNRAVSWDGVRSESMRLVIAAPKAKSVSIPGFLKYFPGVGQVAREAADLAVKQYNKKLEEDSKNGKLDVNSRVVSFSVGVKMENGIMKAGLADALSPLEAPANAQDDVKQRYGRSGLNVPLTSLAEAAMLDMNVPLDEVSEDGQTVVFGSSKLLSFQIAIVPYQDKGSLMKFLDVTPQTLRDKKTGRMLENMSLADVDVRVTVKVNKATGDAIVEAKTIPMVSLNPDLKNKFILLPNGTNYPVTFPNTSAIGQFQSNANCVGTPDGGTGGTPAAPATSSHDLSS